MSLDPMWLVFLQKGTFGHTHVPRKDDMNTQGKDSHPQAKEGGLEQTLSSEPTKGTDPTNTLASDFRPTGS